MSMSAQLELPGLAVGCVNCPRQVDSNYREVGNDAWPLYGIAPNGGGPVCDSCYEDYRDAVMRRQNGLAQPEIAHLTRITKWDSLPERMLWNAYLIEQPRALWGLVVPQYRIEGRRVDLALPTKEIAIEIDSYRYHADVKGRFKEDCRRTREFAGMGWLTFPYAAIEVLQNPARCIQDAARRVATCGR
jgi:very-short-patch-repair endonuclease